MTRDTEEASAPHTKISRRPTRNAGEAEGRQLKHGEGLVEDMERQPSEKNLPQWKGHRNSHQKPRRSRTRGAEARRSHKREHQTPRPPDPREDAGRRPKGGKAEA